MLSIRSFFALLVIAWVAQYLLLNGQNQVKDSLVPFVFLRDAGAKEAELWKV